MQTDKAITYNSLYEVVKLAISNIKNLGFDVTNLENELSMIHNKVNDSIKVNYVKGMALATEAGYVLDYSKGISELEKLKNKLDNYDVYAVAYNTCSFINNKLNDDISYDELSKIVSKIIFALKSIGKSKTIDYDNEKHIVEKIYETAYNVIKYEILLKGESQLYLFVKNEDTNISYFNNLIIGDIEKIDLRLEEHKNIETKMFELGQKGIYSNYLDSELIKLVLLADKSHDLKSVLVKNINNIANEISLGYEKIKNLEDPLKKKMENERELKGNTKKGRRRIKTQIASLIVTISILTGGALSVPKYAKKAVDSAEYDKKVEIYSSETGLDSHVLEKNVASDLNPTGSVLARIYDDNGNYSQYDISNQKYDDMRDYYDYVRDNYETDGLSIEIERDSYEKHTNIEESKLFRYLLLLVITIWTEIFTLNMFDGYAGLFDYVRIKRILETLKNNKSSKRELEECTKEIEDLVSDALNTINHNEELRSRFNELYKENEDLLSNSFELDNKVNNSFKIYETNRVKKLIKERE